MIVNKVERLIGVMKKSQRRIIGLMSGMSMDGVDLAVVTIKGVFPALTIELEDTLYRPFTTTFQARLRAARDGSAKDICELNVVVAHEFAATVNAFLKKKYKTVKAARAAVDAIGSHGQTLVHLPPGKTGESHGSTLQVGCGSVIAEATGIITISNFRVRDMAVGGQGAPLVPLVDYLLYRRSNETIALNNLGSISNVTVVTPKLSDVIAFDTGPANMLIDEAARRIPGNKSGLDDGGKMSATGTVHEKLLQSLLALPYFALPPPKSAGYGAFGPQVLESLLATLPMIAPRDLLRTMVEFSAETIAQSYERFILPTFPKLKRAIFSGGGTYNVTLMRRVRERLPRLAIEVLTEKDKTFSDAKEALAFAVLANETLSGRTGNVPGATGAKRSVILGEISL